MNDEVMDMLTRNFYMKEVTGMIIDKYGLSPECALNRFLNSETFQMFCQPELELWEFAPFGIFDMWEAEQFTGNPRNSVYIREPLYDG